MKKINDIKVYKALIKCNNIGKILGAKSAYIMINGMLMFCPFDKNSCYYDETDNNISIAFINNKLSNELQSLIVLPLFISGNEFRQMDKLYGNDFKEIQINNDSISIIYDTMVNESIDDIQETFKKQFLIKHPEYDNKLSDDAYVTDIIVMQEYKRFALLYTPKMKASEIKYDIKFINYDNYLIKKLINFKNEYKSYKSDLLQIVPLNTDMMETLINSLKPKVLKLKFPNGIYKLRIMKSLFKGYNKSSTVNIIILPINLDSKLFRNIIVIGQKDFLICSAYLSIMY